MSLIFAIFGLALVNMFSIGTGSYTMKSDSVYKSSFANFASFVTFLVIISVGTVIILCSDFKKLNVNPESIDHNSAEIDLPVYSDSIHQYNEEQWYPLTKSFLVEESCDGVVEPKKTCHALDYKIFVQTTSGTLRFN